MDEDTKKLVMGGDLQGLKELVEDVEVKKRKRDSLLDAVEKDGQTALHVAAHNNHPSIIQWLLSSNEGGGRAAGFTKVLAKDSGGCTALHLAAGEGHLQCCQALIFGSKIEKGERTELLNAVCNEKMTALHHASCWNHSSVIQCLLSAGGGRAAGFTNVLARMHDRRTALHIAAEKGYLQCCQALVYGSNIENGERAELINAVSEAGWTVLHCAVSNNRPVIVQWLLSFGEGGGRAAGFTSASITANNAHNHSALHFAVTWACVGCLNVLLLGCTVGERLTLFLHVDNHGWTALHYAAHRSRADIIRELLLHYPETQTIVDHRDHRGMAALHRAVIGGVDEESKKEWRQGFFFQNIGYVPVVEALLTRPKKVDDAKRREMEEDEEEREKKPKQQQQQAAMVDPNLGTKVE